MVNTRQNKKFVIFDLSIKFLMLNPYLAYLHQRALSMIYLILAHDSPESLYNLVKKLQDQEVYFVIHIDKNSDIFPFKMSLSEIQNCYFIYDRLATKWGSFNLVEATLQGFKYIKNNLNHKGRVVLLSGTCYPIKNSIHINDYLKSHPESIFIEYEAIPKRVWHTGGTNRFPFYDDIKTKIALYGGSQWFSIPYKALDIIFEFLDLNPDFTEYFRYVRIPDESFFQTLFLNCGEEYISENIINQNLHYIKWSPPFMHPNTMIRTDLTELKNSEKLFARKFDPSDSYELLQELESIM